MGNCVPLQPWGFSGAAHVGKIGLLLGGLLDSLFFAAIMAFCGSILWAVGDYPPMAD